MRPAAEAEQLRTDVAADEVVVGFVEHPLVPVAGPRQQQEDVAVGNRGVVHASCRPIRVRASIWLDVS